MMRRLAAAAAVGLCIANSCASASSTSSRMAMSTAAEVESERWRAQHAHPTQQQQYAGLERRLRRIRGDAAQQQQPDQQQLHHHHHQQHQQQEQHDAPASIAPQLDDTAPRQLQSAEPDRACLRALTNGDSVRDNLLFKDPEYVRFVNHYSGYVFENSWISFDTLPPYLQSNFDAFSAAESRGRWINVVGSKPGAAMSPDQTMFLIDLCTTTKDLIDNPPPTQAPVELTCTINFDQFQCDISLARADNDPGNDRDDLLNRVEFAAFASRMDDANDYPEFDVLPAATQDVFDEYATTNQQIDITGARPNIDPTQPQADYLFRVCCATLESFLAGSRMPSSSPSISMRPTQQAMPTQAPSITAQPTGVPSAPPTTLPPTFPPGISEAYNAFIISSPPSTNLEGDNRNVLNQAYTLFVTQNLPNITLPQPQRQLRAQQRRLQITYAPDSAEIYRIIESACPSTAATVCHTAFAKFQLTIDGEDPEVVSDAYTAATQDSIAEGALQTALLEVQEFTVLRIENATFPVLPVDDVSNAPTQVPTQGPGTRGGGGDGGGGDSNTGMIAGIIAGVCVVCCCGGFFYMRSRGNGGGQRMDVDKEPPQQQQQPASTGNLNAFGGASKGDENSDESDDSDDEEQKPKEQSGRLSFGGDPANSFGFGMSKTKGFGDDDDDDSNSESESDNGDENDDENDDEQDNDNDENDIFGGSTSNNNNNDTMGFGSNGFDEPSVLEESKEVLDSASESRSMFGEDNKAGWLNDGGTADNSTADAFFGSNDAGGWGVASNVQDEAENIFGDSAFDGETKSEGSESRSHSQSQEDEGSYTSDDGTYESEIKGGDDYNDDAQSFSSGSSSRTPDQPPGRPDNENFDSASSQGSMPSKLKRADDELDNMIDDGNWDGIVEAAENFSTADATEDTLSNDERSLGEPSQGDDNSRGSEGSGSYSSSEEGSAVYTDESSLQSADKIRRAEYRSQVEALVRLTVPDEIGEIDAMMDRFRGREDQLISTLQNMQERGGQLRARAAVHKSKGRAARSGNAFQSDTGITEATKDTMAGAAVIAAASMTQPTDPVEDDGDDGYDDEEEVADNEGMSFEDDVKFGDTIEEGSYESGSQSYSEDERSYYSGDSGSGSRSPSRSRRSDDDEGSYYSNESGSRSYRDGEGSYYSDEDGSRSRRDGEGSYSSNGSGSYDDEGSYYSGDEGSRSRSRRDGDGEGSSYSNEDRSRSYTEEEEGSYYSDEE